MAITDLITEYQQLATHDAALTQQVADLQNQIDTANLQHMNDTNTITKLTQDLVDDGTHIEELLALENDNTKTIGSLSAKLAVVQTQLAQLNSVKVYDALEYLPWALNTKAEVGGSGLGTGGSKLPGVEMAELWINPDPPIAPKTTNFFDGYFTQDKPPDDSITRWTTETTFIFPTQTDIDACNCLELEFRQVLLIPKGLMFVGGAQLNRGSNTLRYWNHGDPAKNIVKGWKETGQPCPAFAPLKPMHVLVTGHRDATTIYHDYISIDGVKTDLTGTSYPAWTEPSPWRQMNRCALQIDSKESATPTMCRVKIGNTKFTVSA